MMKFQLNAFDDDITLHYITQAQTHTFVFITNLTRSIFAQLHSHVGALVILGSPLRLLDWPNITNK